jgi:predicted HTH domain antitoxin
MKTISIKIPDEVLENFENTEQIEKTVFEDFIIEQRQIGNISLGRAAELLGITYGEFVDLLGKKGLSYINASVNEIDKSYKGFTEAFNDNRK